MKHVGIVVRKLQIHVVFGGGVDLVGAGGEIGESPCLDGVGKVPLLGEFDIESGEEVFFGPDVGAGDGRFIGMRVKIAPGAAENRDIVDEAVSVVKIEDKTEEGLKLGTLILYGDEAARRDVLRGDAEIAEAVDTGGDPTSVEREHLIEVERWRRAAVRGAEPAFSLAGLHNRGVERQCRGIRDCQNHAFVVRSQVGDLATVDPPPARRAA